MISIIIPTLNEEKLIEKTLDNLKGIISVPYEIIISDGNSTDNTLLIAKRYNSKIISYRGEKRQTIAGGKNSGAAAAKGEFLVFIDADVIIPHPDDFFHKALGYFEKDADLAAIGVALKVLSEHETFADKILWPIINFTHSIANNFLHVGSASGEFQMIRKEAFLKAGGYDESLAVFEDNDMFIRLAKGKKTKFVNELKVFHTSRRAHRIGWPKLLIQWALNAVSVIFFKKAFSQEWKPIR